MRPRTEDLPIGIRRLGGNGADGPELPMAHRACPSRSGQSAPGRKPKTQMKRRPLGGQRGTAMRKGRTTGSTRNALARSKAHPFRAESSQTTSTSVG